MTYLLYIIFVAFFGLFLVKCISVVKTSTFSFDGAMNALAVHSLFDSNNNVYSGYNFFDYRIQTGTPVTGLVAISFLIFGESFEAGLLINLIYALFFVFALVYYLKSCLNLDFIYVLLAFLMFSSTRQLFYHAFSLYGELPALTFFLFSLIFFHKYLTLHKPQQLILSGMFLGLSILTKTVLLISIPAFALTIILLFSIKKWKMTEILRFLGSFLLGITIPVVIFEVVKLMALGKSAYILWWKDMSKSIAAQAGVISTYEDTPGLINKLQNHLTNLSINTDIPVWFILFILSFILLSFILLSLSLFLNKNASRYNVDSQNPPVEILTIIIITLSYFGWWLLITPSQKAMFRRIINGVYLAEICIPIILFYLPKLITKSTNKKKKDHFVSFTKILSLSITVLLIFVSITRFIKYQHFIISFKNSDLKNSYLTAGDYIQNLPEESKVYGTGWWQAPILSFSSKRDFYNIDPVIDELSNSNLLNNYFVSDHYEYLIDPNAPLRILNLFEYELKFSENQVEIYKLIRKLPES